jgi:HEAT repeat protein
LPPSYRTVLSLSNGAHADPEGITPLAWPHPSPSIPAGFGFLPVDRVQWLSDAEPDLVETYLAECEASPGQPLAYDGADVSDIVALRRGALLIGSAADGVTVLVRATRAQEWQLWTIIKETVIGYRSFRSWLNTVTHSVRVRDLPAAFDRLRGGDYEVHSKLRRMRDPSAVPLLAARLDDALPVARGAIAALSSIGTDEAASALEPILQQEQAVIRSGQQSTRDLDQLTHDVGVVLWQMNNQRAADLLAKYGKHLLLQLRGDPRAGELALADLVPPEYDGAITLAYTGDQKYLRSLTQAADQAADPDARYRIALARLMLGDRSVEPELRNIANDPSHPRQPAAKASLAKLATEGKP